MCRCELKDGPVQISLCPLGRIDLMEGLGPVGRMVVLDQADQRPILVLTLQQTAGRIDPAEPVVGPLDPHVTLPRQRLKAHHDLCGTVPDMFMVL